MKLKLNKKVAIICGISAAVVLIIVGVLVAVLNQPKPEENVAEETPTSTQPEVNYDQKVTAADGSAFKAEYTHGAKADFSARFADLTCTNNCRNVSEVKVGNKTLTRGEDYDLQKGSVIVILLANFMESLSTGRHELQMTIEEGGKKSVYGVKFSVAATPTCKDDEVLKNGKCEKKSEEKTEDKNKDDAKPDNSETSDPEPEQSDEPEEPDPEEPDEPEPSKTPEEIECESRPGPVSVTKMKWLSREDATSLWGEGWGESGSEWVLGTSAFTIASAKMKLQDGKCLPSNIMLDIGVGYQPTTYEMAQEYAAKGFMPYRIVLGNLGQAEPHLVVWEFADGSTAYEPTSAPDAALCR